MKPASLTSRCICLCMSLFLGGCIMSPLPRNTLLEPIFEQTTDGCTLAPDFNFSSCCRAHDAAYWRGGSCEDRRRADAELHSCIKEKGHPVLAGLYYLTVRATGSPRMPTPWRWGFGWPYGTGYSEACP